MREVRRTGWPGESAYGFAQAVRDGDVIYVSGQTASRDDGGVEGPGDLGAQLRVAYAKIAALLDSFGADLTHVADETVFVTDMAAMLRDGVPARRALYREAAGGDPSQGDVDVASTLVEVKGLASPDLLVEIKCTARYASPA